LIFLSNGQGKVDLALLLVELGRRGVNELHVEAGHKLNGSLWRAGLVDELLLYLAPSLIGDEARGLFHWPALSELAGQRRLQVRDLRQVGGDIRILARPA
jgi:diaminohydroxyphosphoribosylaminopyrimidine deaminase/5-amino-6-(5-phosphoribosylamino)uracil reductase